MCCDIRMTGQALPLSSVELTNQWQRHTSLKIINYFYNLKIINCFIIQTDESPLERNNIVRIPDTDRGMCLCRRGSGVGRVGTNSLSGRQDG